MVTHADSRRPLPEDEAPDPDEVAALLRLHAELLDPDNDAYAIVASVGADPVLAAAVLRAGNSAMFGAPGRAFTLSEAVARLGRWELRALVVTELGRRALATPLPSYGMDRGSLWRTGVAGALAARAWARRSAGKQVNPET
ncbi:MAG TPA: HDOD domain-containing protein, partial [Dehalococcoidia bacterium]|nr:HDOD domain-containing protein [Dehalococcoidia bacterium]